MSVVVVFGFLHLITQMLSSSSLGLNVELVALGPLVTVQVPAALHGQESLASLSFGNPTSLAKGEQTGSVYGQERGEGAEQPTDCRKAATLPHPSEVSFWELTRKGLKEQSKYLPKHSHCLCQQPVCLQAYLKKTKCC